MPKNTESTTKFKADITNFKAAMQEATRQIKLANSEFKAATAGMDNWSKSTDGVSKKIDQLTDVLDAQERQLEALEADYKKTVDEQGAASKGAVELQTKINNQKAAITGTKTELEKWNTKLDELEKEQKEAKTPLDNLTDAIDDQEKQLEDLKSAYKQEVFAGNKEKAAELAKEIQNVSGELKENKSKMEELDKAADDLDETVEDTSDGFTVMKGALANLVADGIRLAIEAMKDLATETVQVGMDFDSAMAQVQAVSGATGDEYDQLREKAKEMGSTTKFTASESAEAFNYMAMAGWKTEDMLDGIEGVLNLAAASGTDLATTSDIVTDALTAMGYSAEDAGHLADVMAAASSNANTNVEMMGATFKYAAPVVGALGYSMEDTAVAIGLMANSGIKAEQAGTTLRSVLSRLAAPPKEAQDAMDALGVSLTDADGNMKSLDQVMAELQAAFNGLSETQQTQYAKQIAGTEAMSGFLAIVNAAPEDVDKLKSAVENCDGAAADMAATMQDNLGGDMTKLGSQFEGVQLAIYEKFEPALRSGVEVLSKLLDGFTWLINHSTEVTATLAAIAAGVAAYLAYTTAVKLMAQGWNLTTIAIKAATLAQGALNAVMSLNPIGLVVAAVAALTAAFVVLWNKSESFRAFFIKMWETIKTKVSAIVTAIVNFFKKAWDNIKSVWSTVTQFFTNIWLGIQAIFSAVVEWFTQIFTNAWEGIKAIWQTVSEWFNIYVIEPVKAIFEPIVEWFAELFGSILATITSTFEVIASLALGCWEAIKIIWEIAAGWFNETVLQPLIGFFTTIWNGIKTAASTAWNFIKSIWKAVSGWFNKTVITPVKKFFTGLWNGIKTAASTAWNGIKTVWKAVSGWFNSTVVTPIKNVFTGVWSTLTSGAKKAWSGIKSVFSHISDWFKNVFSKAWKAVKNVFSTGGKVFDGMKEGIVEAFKTVVNAIIKGINKVIAIPFKAINKVLKKIKNVGIGKAKPFKNIVDEIDIPEIPTLAKGGVLNAARLVMAGEDGAEAIVPLEKNKQWIKKVVDEVMSLLGSTDLGLNINLDVSKGRISTGQSIGGTQGGSIGGNREQVINFTQNITSPKAVDRLSLYRQTNNMLFTAKVRLQDV